MVEELGDYLVRRLIGEGGMGKVYEAEERLSKRRVALKVLHPELAYAIGGDRFLREIEVAANLTHPHIVPLFDSGEVDGLLYYVMPYIKGESLRDRLAGCPQLPLEEAVHIAENVASALAYAHGQATHPIATAPTTTAANRSSIAASVDSGRGPAARIRNNTRTAR